ncbi:MAG: FMN-binding glutamate synthase family protein [Clostridiales bacterium]|nr:FMN-binding glutamate synthase family protein [Clostridiales bacterium]
MTYSPSLTSAFLNTKNRSDILSPQSGLCSLCSEGCEGRCELGLASVLGARTVYPTTTGSNQVASEKNYPFDYSHFNINGRVFGAVGIEEKDAHIFNVNLESEYGYENKVKTKLPLFLPALIKLNWKDYFAGAAMAGVPCVIGESAIDKDPNLEMRNCKVIKFEWLKEILESFSNYDRGYGQIILQCNCEDDMFGLPEYAIEKQGVKAIEFKFGQSAKGTQPVNKMESYEEAVKEAKMGYVVNPNPLDEKVKEAYEKGVCPNFYKYARLPMWTEEYLEKRIAQLKQIGLENVYFKMAGYDVKDIERVIKMASNLKVDMITFDGAGGGSGYSPCKMMNEWSYPTVVLEKIVCDVLDELEDGDFKPAITVTGGFASEDQAYKALALGEGNVTHIGYCRAAMAAAMASKNIGAKINEGKVPEYLKKYGSTVEEIFGDLPDLRAIYGKDANRFPPGAIGTFSYLNKLGFGIKHFAALNRKFDIKYLDRNDLIPLTSAAENLMFK